MTYANQSKNTTTFTNQPFGSVASLTWDAADFTWNAAQGTWDAPRDVFTPATKNTTTFSNQSKS